MNIHLDSPFADAFVNAFVFIKGVRTGINQIFQRPLSITVLQAIIYCLVAD
jgi:hypothetical protein